VTAPERDVDEDLVRSFDGTFLTARRLGDGAGEPILFANALGANSAVWRRTLAQLALEHTIVTWDHRGFHGSVPVAGERLDARAHAEDALAVADHHDIERFAVVSWSNGARVALEIAQAHPQSVSALALVCGGYGHPLERLVRNLELSSLLPVAAGIAKRVAPLLGVGFRALASRPELAGVIRQSGLVAGSADAGAIAELVRGLAAGDLAHLLRSYEALMAGGDAGLVQGLGVPTLLIGGSRDQFTSLDILREMAAEIPRSRLEIYDDATHYLPAEHPARLAEDLHAFLATSAPPPAPSGP
jgi:3-oxoadipate enol-lactonase